MSNTASFRIVAIFNRHATIYQSLNAAQTGTGIKAFAIKQVLDKLTEVKGHEFHTYKPTQHWTSRCDTITALGRVSQWAV